jgi:N-hydroxyarylamine O-acetyltransferase
MSELNLDAYFERIRFGGGTQPTYENLATLVAAHVANIPFENLDVLLARPIRLDLQSIQGKLVHGGRGGYCFEHATLLAAVLEQLRFSIKRHSARVILQRSLSPRTHMFLTVQLPEGTFVLDPGFGRLAARLPVPLDSRPAKFGQEVHRMINKDGVWVMRASVSGDVQDGWVSTLEEDTAIDFEMANYFTSTHPTSLFRKRIIMGAAGSDTRVSVLDCNWTFYAGGKREVRQVTSRAEFRSLVREWFRFDLPELESLSVPSLPQWGHG